MQCNIDDQGARIRLVWGIMNLIVAAVLAGLAWWAGFWWIWLLAACCAIAGAFAIYEARKKWCVLRAMGLRTKV